MKLSQLLASGLRRPGLFFSFTLGSLILPWMTGCGSPDLTDLFQTERHCTVASIHDGDTMHLDCGGERLQVRVLGARAFDLPGEVSVKHRPSWL